MIKEGMAETPQSSIWETAMDLLVSERNFGQGETRPMQTLPLSASPMTSFNNAGFAPAGPAPDMPDVNAIQRAVAHDASQIVTLKQNELLTPQANPDTIEKGIRDAQSVAQDAKTELAKFDKPAGADGGADGNKPGLGRTIAVNVAGGLVTGSVVNLGFTMAGMANPMTGPVVAACTTLKTGCDIAAAAMGRGSYGDTTPTRELRTAKTGREKESSSYGYDRSASTPAPVMDNFNRMMGSVPGAAKPGRELLVRADVANLPAQGEIKFGPEALARMEAHVDRLSQKADSAATAFERRRDQGATVGLPDAAEAVLARKLDPESAAFKVADSRQSVQIFNNMA